MIRGIRRRFIRIAIAVLAVVSSLCCLANFAIGRIVGLRVGRSASGASPVSPVSEGNLVVSVTQSLGQKNTVFSIWMGYTFFTPLTSITGGFYSIWQNLINSWQLEQKRKKENNL